MKYLPVSGRSCHHLGGEQAYFQLFAEQRLVIKLLRLFHYKFAETVMIKYDSYLITVYHW